MSATFCFHDTAYAIVSQSTEESEKKATMKPLLDTVCFACSLYVQLEVVVLMRQTGMNWFKTEAV